MLRALLFDFNGVLVDDEPIHCELLRQVLAEEGIDLSPEDYYRDFLGLDDRGCFVVALRAHGDEADAVRLTRLVTRKAAYYRQRIRREGYPFFAGAADLVAQAAAADLVLGIVSNALRSELEGALDQLNVRDDFKVLITREDVEHGKPDPEGYRGAVSQLNARPPLPERLFHPHEVLAIEDSPAGLQAATEAGLRTLGVAHTRPVEDLTNAEHRIPSLATTNLSQIEALFES